MRHETSHTLIGRENAVNEILDSGQHIQVAACLHLHLQPIATCNVNLYRLRCTLDPGLTV